MHHVFPTFGEGIKGAAEQAVAAPEASMVMSTARHPSKRVLREVEAGREPTARSGGLS